MADRPDDETAEDDPEGPRFVPWGTLLLFGVNVAVLLAMQADGASLMLVDQDLLVTWGGASAVEIWNGEVWRLFSSMFVHGAIWHLGLNMWVLLQVGRVLERLLGTSRFLLLYTASGLFGAALSLLVHPYLSVGASGAIFGVVGGLFAFAVLSRGRPMSRMLLSALTPFVVVTLIVGFLVAFIDNSAHVGGLVAGFLLGLGLLGDRERAPAGSGWGSLVVALTLFVVVVPIALKPSFNPRYAVAKAWTALLAGDVAEAQRLAGRAAEMAADDPAVLILHGRLAMDEDRAAARGSSRGYFKQALTLLDEDDPEAAFMATRGLIGGRPLSEVATAFDARTTRGLCDALIDETGGKVTALIANNCAWVMVKSTDEAVRDPKRGLELAERAIRLSLAEKPPGGGAPKSPPEFLHTLAEALAQTGDPVEARITMERVVLEAEDDDPRWEEERLRFARMAEEQAPPLHAKEPDPREPGEDLR